MCFIAANISFTSERRSGLLLWTEDDMARHLYRHRLIGISVFLISCRTDPVFNQILSVSTSLPWPDQTTVSPEKQNSLPSLPFVAFSHNATFDDPPQRLAAELTFGNEAQTERLFITEPDRI